MDVNEPLDVPFDVARSYKDFWLYLLRTFKNLVGYYSFDQSAAETKIREAIKQGAIVFKSVDEREEYVRKTIDLVYEQYAPETAKFTSLAFKKDYSDKYGLTSDAKKSVEEAQGFLSKLLELLKKLKNFITKGLQYVALFAFALSIVLLVMICMTGKNVTKLLRYISDIFYETYDTIKKFFYRIVEGALSLSPTKIVEGVISTYHRYIETISTIWENIKDDELANAFTMCGVTFFISMFSAYIFGTKFIEGA